MIFFIKHPAERYLFAYADGDLAPRDAKLVARHLLRCSSCRNVVRFTLKLRRAAQELAAQSPTPPADLLEEILEARTSGARALLPVPEELLPERLRTKQHFLRVTARVAVVLALCLIATPFTYLRGSRGQLVFVPTRPRAGDTIYVRYTPTSGLARQPYLHLRGEVFYRSNARNIDVLAVLIPDGNGRFEGYFFLPDSAVFARFAVEDSSGRILDTNGHRLWDILAHRSDGVPRFDALRARAFATYATHWSDFVTTAEALTRIYPDSPATWYINFQEHLQRRGQSVPDSFLSAYRVEFQRLEQNALARGYDAQYAADLVMLAALLRDEVARSKWLSRLYAADSTHDVALVFRAIDLVMADTVPVAERLAQIERLWQLDAPPYRREITDAGWYLAQRSGDREQIVLWGQRYLERYPRTSMPVFDALWTNPSTRVDGIRIAHRLLERAEREPWWPRPVTMTMFQYAREIGEHRSRLSAELSLAALVDGFTSEELDTLWQATQGVWDPELFVRAADAFMRSGDTLRAAALHARLVVDPLTSPIQRDSLDYLGQSWLGHARWQATLATANRALLDFIFDSDINIRLPHDLILHEFSDTSRVLLMKQLRRGVHFVAILSCACQSEIASIPGFLEVADSLAGAGILPLVIASLPQPDSLATALRNRGFGGPLYLDPKGEIAAAFHVLGSPAYFLVDERGVVRFEHSNPYALLRPGFLMARQAIDARLTGH